MSNAWLSVFCVGALYLSLQFTVSYMNDRCVGIAQLGWDGTRAETRFRLSVKRTSPSDSAAVTVQSTAGSRGVGGQLVEFVLCWRGCAPLSCKACWIPTPFCCYPFTSPPTRRRAPWYINRAVPVLLNTYFSVRIEAWFALRGKIAPVLNPLKTKRICFIQGLSAYRAVNTLHFGYKNQSLDVL
jgi:hypothetical protein